MLYISGLDEDIKTDREEIKTDSESDTEEDDEKSEGTLQKPLETPYSENFVEELGLVSIGYYWQHLIIS